MQTVDKTFILLIPLPSMQYYHTHKYFLYIYAIFNNFILYVYFIVHDYSNCMLLYANKQTIHLIHCNVMNNER